MLMLLPPPPNRNMKDLNSKAIKIAVASQRFPVEFDPWNPSSKSRKNGLNGVRKPSSKNTFLVKKDLKNWLNNEKSLLPLFPVDWQDIEVFSWIEELFDLKIDSYRCFADGILLCCIAATLCSPKGYIPLEDIKGSDIETRWSSAIDLMYDVLAVPPSLSLAELQCDPDRYSLRDYILDVKKSHTRNYQGELEYAVPIEDFLGVPRRRHSYHGVLSPSNNTDGGGHVYLFDLNKSKCQQSASQPNLNVEPLMPIREDDHLHVTDTRGRFMTSSMPDIVDHTRAKKHGHKSMIPVPISKSSSRAESVYSDISRCSSRSRIPVPIRLNKHKTQSERAIYVDKILPRVRHSSARSDISLDWGGSRPVSRKSSFSSLRQRNFILENKLAVRSPQPSRRTTRASSPLTGVAGRGFVFNPTVTREPYQHRERPVPKPRTGFPIYKSTHHHHCFTSDESVAGLLRHSHSGSDSNFGLAQKKSTSNLSNIQPVKIGKRAIPTTKQRPPNKLGLGGKLVKKQFKSNQLSSKSSDNLSSSNWKLPNLHSYSGLTGGTHEPQSRIPVYIGRKSAHSRKSPKVPKINIIGWWESEVGKRSTKTPTKTKSTGAMAQRPSELTGMREYFLKPQEKKYTLESQSKEPQTPESVSNPNLHDLAPYLYKESEDEFFLVPSGGFDLEAAPQPMIRSMTYSKSDSDILSSVKAAANVDLGPGYSVSSDDNIAATFTMSRSISEDSLEGSGNLTLGSETFDRSPEARTDDRSPLARTPLVRTEGQVLKRPDPVPLTAGSISGDDVSMESKLSITSDGDRVSKLFDDEGIEQSVTDFRKIRK